MNGFQSFIQSLLVETFREPQAAARRLVEMQLPLEARLIGLVLVSVLGLLVARASVPMIGSEDIGPVLSRARDLARHMATHPWIGVPVQAASILLIAAVMAWGGRPFGGKGRFSDALLLFVWLEFIMVTLQALQLIGILVFPFIGGLVALASYVIFIWLLVQFILVLHGFSNPVLVLIGMIASFFAVLFAASILLLLLGIGIPGQGV